MNIYTSIVTNPNALAFLIGDNPDNPDTLTETILLAQEKAIRLSELGTLVNYHGEENYLYPTCSTLMYDYNNGVVSWANPTGTFVMPSMDDFTDILERAGYSRGLYVPFSNGDYPVKLCSKWNELLAERNYKKKLLTIADILSYSSEHGLSGICSQLLSQYTLEIPVDGIEFHGSEKYYPKNISKWNNNMDYLGSYYIKNKCMVFVDYLGRTFVAPYCEKLHEALERAGYASKEQPVPFANGEKPTSEWYCNRWDYLAR